MKTQIIDPNQKLKKKLLELKEKYSSLFEEREYMVNFETQNLTALYIEKIGKYQYEIFALQTELKATKLKQQMIQAAKNREEQINQQKIEQKIKEKLKDYYRIIEQQAKDAQTAKEIAESPILKPELVKELKAIHMYFVKRLHPDVNPHYSEKDKELLLKVQTAYKKLDVKYLREALLAHSEGKTEIKESTFSMQEQIEFVKSNIDKLKDKISQLKETFPFIYQDKLTDEQWIAGEQKVAQQKISGLKNELFLLKLYIEELLSNTSPLNS